MIERFARVCYYLVTSLAVRFCALVWWCSRGLTTIQILHSSLLR